MARRTTTPQPPQPAVLTPDDKRRAIPKLEKRIEDLKAFDLSVIQDYQTPKLQALEQAIERTLQDVFGSDTVEARRYRNAADLETGAVLSLGFGYGGGPNPREIRNSVAKKIEASIVTLKGSSRVFEKTLRTSRLPLWRPRRRDPNRPSAKSRARCSSSTDTTKRQRQSWLGF